MLWIFLLLIITIIIYSIIYTIRWYLKIKNSLLTAWFNTNFCGQQKCPPSNRQLFNTIPTSIDINNLSVDIAQYSSIVIYSLEKAAQNNVKPIYPLDLTIIKELYNDNTNPIFGAVFTDNFNRIWVAFRGTLEPQEWAQDLEYTQVPISNLNTKTQNRLAFLRTDLNITPKVHEGFLNAYQNMRNTMLTAIDSIPNSQNKIIIVTGHSLGAAIATLAALDLKQSSYNNVVIYSFASPRIGDGAFISLVNTTLPLYRFVNICDIIPNMPPAVSPNLQDPNNPYIYEHAGTMIPFQVNRLSMINNHLIPAYMEGLETIKVTK